MENDALSDDSSSGDELGEDSSSNSKSMDVENGNEGGNKTGEIEEEEEELTWAMKVLNSTPFAVISLVFILGNTLILALDSYANSPGF